MERITVVTPTLPDRFDQLVECIMSVDAQTVPVADHVIITDKNRHGPSWARNVGIKDVKTEFTLFLDDDDVLYKDYIETVTPFLDNYDVIYTWCKLVNFKAHLDVPFDENHLRQANFIPVTAVVRTELLREVGCFDKGPYEDWKLWKKILDAGGRFKPIYLRKWEYRKASDGQNLKDMGWIK